MEQWETGQPNVVTQAFSNAHGALMALRFGARGPPGVPDLPSCRIAEVLYALRKGPRGSADFLMCLIF